MFHLFADDRQKKLDEAYSKGFKPSDAPSYDDNIPFYDPFRDDCTGDDPEMDAIIKKQGKRLWDVA